MTTGPVWDWLLTGADGRPVDQPISPAFGNRFDAEVWLGEQWRRLAEQGVAVVRLQHHGQAAAPDLPLPTA